jgi:hypothetical protein
VRSIATETDFLLRVPTTVCAGGSRAPIIFRSSSGNRLTLFRPLPDRTLTCSLRTSCRRARGHVNHRFPEINRSRPFSLPWQRTSESSASRHSSLLAGEHSTELTSNPKLFLRLGRLLRRWFWIFIFFLFFYTAQFSRKSQPGGKRFVERRGCCDAVFPVSRVARHLRPDADPGWGTNCENAI